MNPRKAQFIVCRDSEDMLEWTRYTGASASVFKENMTRIAAYVSSHPRGDTGAAKELGITPKQLETLTEMGLKLESISKELETLHKTLHPIAAKLNPQLKKK